MHRYHPDPSKNDPEDAIYFDDCEDCEHHAKEIPFFQDQYKMNQLWDRMITVETGNSARGYRSHNEQVACWNLWKVFILMERFTNLNPHLIEVGQERT